MATDTYRVDLLDPDRAEFIAQGLPGAVTVDGTALILSDVTLEYLRAHRPADYDGFVEGDLMWVGGSEYRIEHIDVEQTTIELNRVALDMPCEECGAPAGTPCRMLSGRVSPAVSHVIRWRAARQSVDTATNPAAFDPNTVKTGRHSVALEIVTGLAAQWRGPGKWAVTPTPPDARIIVAEALAAYERLDRLGYTHDAIAAVLPRMISDALNRSQ